MEESSTDNEDLHESKKSELETDAAKKTKENEEDHADLQMAWEVLELANNKKALEVEVPAATKVKMRATATQVKVLPPTEVEVPAGHCRKTSPLRTPTAKT